jgi:hypothetical protein
VAVGGTRPGPPFDRLTSVFTVWVDRFRLCAQRAIQREPTVARTDLKTRELEMKASVFALCGVSVALAVAAPASAHHSGSMFDRTKEVKFDATVKELQWTNPHAWLEVMVADASGKETQWSFEMGVPNSLARRGWSPRIVKPGDKVTVTGRPLKDGRPGGHLVSLALADGRVLGQ